MMGTDGIADHIVMQPAFGVGFWDTLADRPVVDGLEITMSLNDVFVTRAEVVNGRGVHIVQRLPGVPYFDAGYVSSPPSTRRFVVNVVDSKRRFLPITFDADCATNGLFVPACLTTSPTETPYIRLFSSAVREFPSGYALIRAQLHDVSSNAPAAWALVSADVGAVELCRGVADDQGRLALCFAYPEPIVSSPPAAQPWHWPLTLRIYYHPQSAVSGTLDLCDVIGQAAARFVNEDSTSVAELEVNLEYGHPLVLRSGTLSHLLVEPA